MRANRIVAAFGVVTIIASVLMFAWSGTDKTETPDTPAGYGARIFRLQGCASCHRIGGGVLRGPDLAGLIPRLRERLEPETYRRYLAGVRQEMPALYDVFHETWEDILSREGDERVRAWLEAHLKNPRFDHPRGTMPSFGHLTPEQTEHLIAFLFTLQ